MNSDTWGLELGGCGAHLASPYDQSISWQRRFFLMGPPSEKLYVKEIFEIVMIKNDGFLLMRCAIQMFIENPQFIFPAFFYALAKFIFLRR